MERNSGQYVHCATAGETYRAHVPAPLPPDPPLAIDADLLTLLEQANRALGRLDGIADLLPDRNLFLYQYVRREAVVSSQIEGTQSSLSDLLLFELAEAPGAPLDDVAEVSQYVAALDHGLKRLAGDFPLCLRLLREIHGVLLAHGRGAHKQPGEFRRSQNWLGGTRPGNAAFVPPPPERLAECLDALERFLHGDDGGLPVLVKTALAHVQFETIHPFLDGNGRLGRLLIILMLVDAGVLRQPLLYLSLYFKVHRLEYYDRLQRVRTHGDWEGWLGFYLKGVAETAQQAVDAARRLLGLFEQDRERIRGLGRIATSALEVHRHLQQRPVSRVAEAVAATGINRTTVTAVFRRLVELGMVRELPGRQRNRVFVYTACLDILSEDTQPL
ncbi:Fic family protein [Immundisolibacter cernigliae]|uniref:Protein adenylyltransferase n=1 Tax=Immundisolibacter cernigliae TaxID=1810504 RepID=A0A1B1YTW3_9GAMM|nr:Fic family protein [Immundisolibacter cernigliae]ANX04215.1 cell filamentation protein Fic [Immundisolibacter cernigliae]